jgi:hypothetical protein
MGVTIVSVSFWIIFTLTIVASVTVIAHLLKDGVNALKCKHCLFGTVATILSWIYYYGVLIKLNL